RGPGTFLDYILSNPVYTIQQKNAFRKDLAPVAWIVSSCTSHNGRHFFIKQLLKYTNIDIYGRCMKNKDWPMHPDGRSFSDREVVARYKFYLSIENSNCDDYVTEKIERPYAVGVVPILDEPKDYSRFLATNHSSIRMDGFATPEQLALCIHQLDQDDNAYLKYLDYKGPATQSTRCSTQDYSRLLMFLRELGDRTIWELVELSITCLNSTGSTLTLLLKSEPITIIDATTFDDSKKRNRNDDESSEGISSSDGNKLHVPVLVKEFAEWFQDKPRVDECLATKKDQLQQLHHLQKQQQ
ncbi:Alpha-(1,3)-fucosyltransferase 11, partial [Mortierella sp. GBA39]